jgi:hypothetical protein
MENVLFIDVDSNNEIASIDRVILRSFRKIDSLFICLQQLIILNVVDNL